jgi:hypothetical protein
MKVFIQPIQPCHLLCGKLKVIHFGIRYNPLRRVGFRQGNIPEHEAADSSADLEADKHIT